MVESDGKLTDVNFYQTEKSVCGRRTTRRKTAQKKKTDPLGRFSCDVEVRFHGNDRFNGRNKTRLPCF